MFEGVLQVVVRFDAGDVLGEVVAVVPVAVLDVDRTLSPFGDVRRSHVVAPFLPVVEHA